MVGLDLRKLKRREIMRDDARFTGLLTAFNGSDMVYWFGGGDGRRKTRRRLEDKR